MARVGRVGHARRSEIRGVIACVVLAAGGSSRFGAAKQLQQLSGETLAHRAARAVIECSLSPIVFVTGADRKAVEESVADLDSLVVVHNNQWQSGLASSIATGLGALEQYSAIDGVVITLADQPLVTSASLNRLIDAFDTDHRIVASGYNETAGVPVVIGSEHISDLSMLEGDRGAGAWIRQRLESVTVIPMPEAAADIDTVRDLARITRSIK
jgi:CTP:molybdopterin cytidylyltransferase MocA